MVRQAGAAVTEHLASRHEAPALCNSADEDDVTDIGQQGP